MVSTSFSADEEGNLYSASVFNGRVTKFRPKPGAIRRTWWARSSTIHSRINQRRTAALSQTSCHEQSWSELLPAQCRPKSVARHWD